MRRLCVAIALCCLTTAPARADELADRIAAAKLRYDTGMAHYQLEEWDAAIAEFEAGFRLRPSPEFLFNIGQAYRLSHRPDKAISFYEKFLRMTPDAPNRDEVQGFIDRARADSAPRPPPAPAPPAPPAVTAAPAATATVAALPPKQRPLYRKPWFWGVLVGSAAVVGAVIAVGVVEGRDGTRMLPLAKF